VEPIRTFQLSFNASNSSDTFIPTDMNESWIKEN